MDNDENKNNNIEINNDKDFPKDSDLIEEKLLENNEKNNSIIYKNEEFIEEIKDKGKEEENEKEKLKLFLITKYSNLQPELFSNEFILDYKCISCGLIPNFETAHEITCCGSLICEECLKKFEEEKKGCPICTSIYI